MNCFPSAAATLFYCFSSLMRCDYMVSARSSQSVAFLCWRRCLRCTWLAWSLDACIPAEKCQTLWPSGLWRLVGGSRRDGFGCSLMVSPCARNCTRGSVRSCHCGALPGRSSLVGPWTSLSCAVCSLRLLHLVLSQLHIWWHDEDRM